MSAHKGKLKLWWSSKVIPFLKHYKPSIIKAAIIIAIYGVIILTFYLIYKFVGFDFVAWVRSFDGVS